jgi:hypothetical protein
MRRGYRVKHLIDASHSKNPPKSLKKKLRERKSLERERDYLERSLSL